MNTTRRNRRKQKRIRNILCGTICAIILVITILLINLLTGAVSKLLPTSDTLKDKDKPSTEQSSELTEESTDTEPIETTLFTVCIDAGHGGKDGGSDDGGSRLEKDDNLALALAVRDYLTAKNVKVVMVRDDDTFLKLSKRCEIANNANADYFVSLHRNTGDGNGVEAWIASDADDEATDLATNILSGLDAAGISRNRGVKTGTQQSDTEDYAINRDSTMPSCIIELGFMNSSEDNQLYDQNLNAYAQNIGDAIILTATTHNRINGASADETTPATEQSTEPADTDTATTNTTSHTITNTPIANIESLDTTTQDWGPGSNVDELNRPEGADSYQQKYASYNANFISENSEDKVIYLTFDEGYEYGCTPSILSTLKEKDVKAVFFVTVPYARDDPQYIEQMIADGHAIGNHSVTHPANGLPSQTIEQQQNEVMETHNYIKDNFGYEMHLFRYPAGKFSDQSLAIVNNCNYKSVFWSFAYLDYDVNNQPDETESLNKLVSKLHPGAIYLLHAESWTNTNILGSFIDQARAAGYEFEIFD